MGKQWHNVKGATCGEDPTEHYHLNVQLPWFSGRCSELHRIVWLFSSRLYWFIFTDLIL